jgi:two-component system, NarL family, response regulator LiaR
MTWTGAHAGMVKEKDDVHGPVQIILVDNHQILAESLRLFLENQEDLAVVSVSRNGDTGLRVMYGDGPQVLVLDLSPRSDLPGVLERAQDAAPSSRIVALSTADHAEIMRAARLPKGDLQVVKIASSEQLVQAFRDAPEGARILISYNQPTPEYRREPEIDLLVRTLSRRERDILELITAGYTNQRIAEARCLSMHTARTHIQNILVKLGVHSKLEAAIFAVQHHLVPLEGEPHGRDQQPTSANTGR